MHRRGHPHYPFVLDRRRRKLSSTGVGESIFRRSRVNNCWRNTVAPEACLLRCLRRTIATAPSCSDPAASINHLEKT